MKTEVWTSIMNEDARADGGEALIGGGGGRKVPWNKRETKVVDL